ncbi:MAG: acyl-acyl-carrier-protein-phospholipid O-acyltransferase, partial [Hyphomonadaceae bacterium]
MAKQFDYSRTRLSLFEALLDAKKKFGGKKIIIEDIDRNPLDYDKVVLSSMVLGRKIAKVTAPNEVVGLLIASSVGAVVSFFGMMAFGRTAAMLNFTAGHRNIRSACEAAQIKTIITARRFIAHAGLEPLIAVLDKHFNVIYLEDIRESISAIDKVRGLSDATFPKMVIAKTDPDAVAVMLFT